MDTVASNASALVSAGSQAANTSSDAIPVLPSVPALDNTYGAVLLGTFFGLILYGITLHQSYRYFRMYPEDRLWIKILVYATLVLETIHSALCCHVCYYYLVTSYFKPTALLFGSWSIKLVLIFCGLVILVSQIFFAWRVYMVGPQYRLVVVAAVILLVGEISFFTAATVKTFMIPTFAGFEHLVWLISTGSAAAITADALLTFVLIITLRKSRTGIKRTDSMIDVLVLYAVTTGLLTTILNFLNFIFTVVYPTNFIYIAFAVTVTKTYANTLLAALNSRMSLRGSSGVTNTDAYSTSIVYGTSNGREAVQRVSPSQGQEKLSRGTVAPTGESNTIIELRSFDSKFKGTGAPRGKMADLAEDYEDANAV